MSKSNKTYLGFDLGASSGRAILGFMENDRLRIEGINRFSNAPVELGGTLYWNFLSLWNNVVDSLRLCSGHCQGKLSGIGIDTWGVDFGLLGADGKLLGNPICYRDGFTEKVVRQITSAIDRRRLFQLTGLVPGRVATLSQLVALRNSPSASRLRSAKTLLFMSDLFRYFLCGDKSAELTAAGSSQLLNVKKASWCSEVFDVLGLPRRIAPRLVKPGTVVGQLQPDLANGAGLNQAPVVAVAGHDTASAAAAVPFADEDCAFISCGTWSVLGVMREKPITTNLALKCGFINEIGLDCVLLAKNIIGLYLFESLRRSIIKNEPRISYAQMISQASQAEHFGCFLDINSPLFFVTKDPLASIKQFLDGTSQKESLTRGAIFRAVLEAIAWSYRKSLKDLEKIIGRHVRRVCIVGGGVRNRLLCQLVADATGLEVIAGPEEATVVGNLSAQALAIGQLKNKEDIRQLVRNSFRLKTYRPKSKELWDKRYDYYLQVLRKSKKVR